MRWDDGFWCGVIEWENCEWSGVEWWNDVQTAAVLTCEPGKMHETTTAMMKKKKWPRYAWA
jgi:hypothetical protein